ncbi:MAG: methionine--tRNA ligase [Alphaproteobacteria bacterium]|nr:methionine--tRNA ligase [Alphaproteobacteria bacterium]
MATRAKKTVKRKTAGKTAAGVSRKKASAKKGAAKKKVAAKRKPPAQKAAKAVSRKASAKKVSGRPARSKAAKAAKTTARKAATGRKAAAGKTAARGTTRATKAAATRTSTRSTSRQTAPRGASRRSTTVVRTKATASTPRTSAAPRGAVRTLSQSAAGTPAGTVCRRPNSFYITTAIAYPNGNPHIGHAYEAVATDALARFARLDGKDVFFLTGTDEHGLKMIKTAQAEGLTPAALSARNTARFRDMDERLHVSFDRFIRTTEEQHHRATQEVWQRMQANGDIYLDSYAGWYSVRDEAYYKEDETHVDADGVRRGGDQNTPVEWVEEESYFFRLSAYQHRLLKLYEEHPDFIGPDSGRSEVLSFVRRGLRDLSISRTTFDWGVKVPESKDHVMYVWVDALTNYLTGIGFPDENDGNWNFWPADVHIIGKDIIKFHTVYWPAFLMSAGLPLPKRVFAHGFLLSRGEKMSKTTGNVVDPFDLADQYGVDQLRYFFLREMPFGQDGHCNHEAIVTRTNADLANDLGNLAQRSLSMIGKQYDGGLPEPGEFSEADEAMLAQADAMIALSREAMATQQIHQWLNVVWATVAEANRYFANQAPWALAKTDPARQKTVLYVTAEVVRQIAILAQPVVPLGAGKLLDSLGIGADERHFGMLGGSVRIAPGTQFPAPTPAFPRYVEPKTQVL